MKKEISRGAEAVIFLDKNQIIKERIKKSYRYFKLDVKLRTTRTRKEVNLLKKSSELIKVPRVISSNETEIMMEYVDGKKLSNVLENLSSKEIDNYFAIVGEYLAKLHNKDIIHNDLTTSNILVNQKEVYFIDFGLGFVSNKVEDKAYDLHLLRQALKSRHFSKYEKAFSQALLNYKKASNNFKEIEERLSKIELRGRYKRKEKNRKADHVL